MNRFKPNRMRKHKNRQQSFSVASGIDANATEILSSEHSTKAATLREALRPEQPMSSKKKKRLDKYIETKLRKEENLELLKKLAANKVDTSLYRSTKDLGVAKDSKRKALASALEREKAGIATTDDKALLYIDTHTDSESSGSEHDLDDEVQPFHNLEKGTTPQEEPRKLANSPPNPIAQQNTSVGTGLKRPLDTDLSGAPVIKKRQRTNKRTTLTVEPAEIPWEGFSDDDNETEDSEDLDEVDSDDDDDESGDNASETDSEDLSSISESDYAAIFSAPFRKAPTEDKEMTARRRTDFKAWADQQLNEARDFAPTQPLSQIEALSTLVKPISVTPREPESDPLPRELQIPLGNTQREAFSVIVERNEQIQVARLRLPIVAEEQKIMEAIHNHPVVVVCGTTGSGKTTQIPQFLYEAGYGSQDGPMPGLIAVTQPRRVAAVTMAKRVGEELGKDSQRVGHQIRFDSTVSKNTRIKFMTDGILLREIAQDFALRKYSAIVIDEAHERSVNTDILIGMASRIVSLRAEMNKKDPDVTPLKLVIMSATLMVDSFTKNPHLFRDGEPPLVESEGRQFPVTPHFARKTRHDYLEETFKKVSRGHKKLPPGTMLVFLTGQSEITSLSKKLAQSLPTVQAAAAPSKVRLSASDAPLEAEDLELGDDRLANDYQSEDSIDSDEEEEDKEFNIGEDEEPGSAKVQILPLYSQLPIEEQTKVFNPPPENTRLIILATNVAETSITIPGVRYVFDCGRAKERKYDKATGVQRFEIGWISKASAMQRAGRAGRTGPGHCYRLYSSAIFERDFEDHATPEILRSPAEAVVLQLKSMDLQHIVNFPFPTPPDREDIAKAEILLTNLGALDKEGKITETGRNLSTYPVSPRFAKMLRIGNQHGCMYLTVALVASLAVPELFISASQLEIHKSSDDPDEGQDIEQARDSRRKAYNKVHHELSVQDSEADGIKLLTTFCRYVAQPTAAARIQFCSDKFLRRKAMEEAFQLYQQLLRLLAHNYPGTIDPNKTQIERPTTRQLAALKQILAVGFLDQVAIRADLAPSPPSGVRKNSKSVRDVPYLTLFPSNGESSSADSLVEQAVFIHPTSILSYASAASLPAYIIYSRLQKSSNTNSNTPKTWMHPVTPISAKQLEGLGRGSPLIEYGKPIKAPELLKDGTRTAWVVPSIVGRPGGREWPLPVQAMKVLQKRNGRGGWGVERVI